MMDRAQWRNYRGYSIVKGRTLGLARYAVRQGDRRLAVFGSSIKAELYVDELNAADDVAQDAAPDLAPDQTSAPLH